MKNSEKWLYSETVGADIETYQDFFQSCESNLKSSCKNMEGSDKQNKWAIKIKKRFVKERTDGLKDHLRVHEERNRNTETPERFPVSQRYLESIYLISKLTNSSWIIDNKSKLENKAIDAIEKVRKDTHKVYR